MNFVRWWILTYRWHTFYGYCSLWKLYSLAVDSYGNCIFWKELVMKFALYGNYMLWALHFIESALYEICILWKLHVMDITSHRKCSVGNFYFMEIARYYRHTFYWKCLLRNFHLMEILVRKTAFYGNFSLWKFTLWIFTLLNYYTKLHWIRPSIKFGLVHSNVRMKKELLWWILSNHGYIQVVYTFTFFFQNISEIERVRCREIHWSWRW